MKHPEIYLDGSDFAMVELEENEINEAELFFLLNEAILN
jgi:hypothetical protein